MSFARAITVIMIMNALISHYSPYASSASNSIAILVHGIASNAEKLTYFKDQLEMHTLNVKTFVPNIGNGEDDSTKNMNLQLLLLRNEIADYFQAYPENTQGNAQVLIIGFSQGGLLARGYVERYLSDLKNFPEVKLITVGTPNGGQYSNGVFSPDYIYNYVTQLTFSVANYWRDPYNYELYVDNSLYLSEINNDKEDNTGNNTGNNKENINNLQSLKEFIMIWSPNDEVIEPPESAMFSTYEIVNGNIEIVSYDQSQYWIKLGLNETNITIYETDCTHLEYVSEGCANKVIELLFDCYLID